jgi:hypothetical protein
MGAAGFFKASDKVEVTSGNGDALVSITVDDDEGIMQTFAFGRSWDSEVLYTRLNTGY